MSNFKYTSLPKVIVFGTLDVTWTPNAVSQKQAKKIYLATYISCALFFYTGVFYGSEGISLKYLNHFHYMRPELKEYLILSCVSKLPLTLKDLPLLETK